MIGCLHISDHYDQWGDYYDRRPEYDRIGTIMIEPRAIRTTEDTTCRMSSTRGPPGMVMAVFKALALDNVCG